jgi:hypothetical protein
MNLEELAAAYEIVDLKELENQLREFVNLLELTAMDGYINGDAWKSFIRRSAKALYGANV